MTTWGKEIRGTAAAQSLGGDGGSVGGKAELGWGLGWSLRHCAGWGRQGVQPSPPCLPGPGGLHRLWGCQHPGAWIPTFASPVHGLGMVCPLCTLFWGGCWPTNPTLTPCQQLAPGLHDAQHRGPAHSAAQGPPLPPAHGGGGNPSGSPLAESSVFTGTQRFAWRDNQLRPQDLAHYKNIKIKWDIETAVLKLLTGSEQM